MRGKKQSSTRVPFGFMRTNGELSVSDKLMKRGSVHSEDLNRRNSWVFTSAVGSHRNHASVSLLLSQIGKHRSRFFKCGMSAFVSNSQPRLFKCRHGNESYHSVRDSPDDRKLPCCRLPALVPVCFFAGSSTSDLLHCFGNR